MQTLAPLRCPQKRCHPLQWSERSNHLVSTLYEACHLHQRLPVSWMIRKWHKKTQWCSAEKLKTGWTLNSIWGRMIPYFSSTKHFTRQTSNLEILCIFDWSHLLQRKKHLRTLIYPYIMCFSGWLVSFFYRNSRRAGCFFQLRLSLRPSKSPACSKPFWVGPWKTLWRRVFGGKYTSLALRLQGLPYQSTRCNSKILSVCYICDHSNVQVFLPFNI